MPKGPRKKRKYDYIVLVLQGGGALGAYQAGVFEGMVEAGFYSPRVPPPELMPDGSPGALSVYDTTPLKHTLERMVDFDLLNRPEVVRYSAGAVHVTSGNSKYFDNSRERIGAQHVMASSALPPAFAPVEIGGEEYWDGGIVSNTPLWYVLDESPDLRGLIVQVDLFSATATRRPRRTTNSRARR